MKKNIPRIYIQNELKIHQVLSLSKDHIHYIKTVLRMNIQDIIEIFNNTNSIFFAKIIYLSKKIIKIKIFEHQFKNIESPLYIHLGQVISKNDKMNFTIQKSIEMGVNIITPLFFKSTNTQKNMIDVSHKIEHWKKIIISACQQCHRNIIPMIQNAQDIFSWCQNNTDNSINIIFHPQSTLTLNDLPPCVKYVRIIIGSEKGFSKNEIFKIIKYGFLPIKLGPRILRTETAAIVAITALQIKFGDF
ncbi:16S rRNA (uracil(1498)-N(3))-methyltransferase [Buchnera aphidicola (Brachycaudus cardui)]|uniref:Ribosomal RNA small subunit methyltransferase E n=1 Tax=Buchnera aphidicola (Brachycaudus cardui) TaxID=557993 RepID=A0A4D6XSF4_9GAMM|nr:16S rRNA (uracil(1498)-N(3))-methyltransferase [Buchnera aphidicola]QCI20542.1 16S rRNA (uracil(1498)-N(3))-methyltransferase [Buchnera aphidicola (Brachycaudus cardui)]